MMKQPRINQLGGSAIGNMVLIAVFAYGVYLGIQYVPQWIESRSLDSMLESIDSQNRTNPYSNAQEVEQAVKNILNLNQMDDMIKNITIRDGQQGINIEVSYDRELNLLFSQKTLHYSKSQDIN